MFSGDLIAFVAGLSAVKSADASVSWSNQPTPSDTSPSITAFEAAGQIDQTHGGANNLRTARIQFDILAGTKDPKGVATVKKLREAINAALVGVAQTMGGTKVGSCMHENDLDFFDAGPLTFRGVTEMSFQYQATS